MTDHLTDEAVKAMLDGATPGPWAMETVRTSCGTCHRIGPFPRPAYASKSEGWACVYDDYPPGVGSPDLLANSRLIAVAPDLARALLDARAERDRLAAELAAANAREAGLRNFVEDFAAAKIDALRFPRPLSPEDEPDPVVDAEEVWAWQADARAALAQPSTEGGE